MTTTTPTQTRSTTDALAGRKNKQRRIAVIGALAGLALAGAVALGVSSFATGAAPAHSATPSVPGNVSPAHPVAPHGNISPAHPVAPHANISPAVPVAPHGNISPAQPSRP